METIGFRREGESLVQGSLCRLQGAHVKSDEQPRKQQEPGNG
jgi:hypothetical protein